MAHSKLFLKVYYSNVTEYSNMIMIRGIKKKLSRNWETSNHKLTKRGDWTFHNVILTYKQDCDVNIFSKHDFSQKIRKLNSICDCIVGTRQICCDSHIMCGLMYLQLWSKQKKNTVSFNVSKKYWNIIDINHWVNLMNDMKPQFLQKFALDFCVSTFSTQQQF